MRESHADVVQGWMYHAGLAVAVAHALLPRGRRPALVWGVRCSDMDLSRYGWNLRAVVGLSVWPADVVANSKTGHAIHRQLCYRLKRSEVIPNGIDTARFRPDPAARARVRAELGLDAGTPVVALVARVDPMKDHDTLLAALERPDGTAALLIGKGTEALPDPPSLRHLGGRTDVAWLLPAPDLVVNSPAFGEGFSNTIAEGMAAGLPAVATDVGDARVIIGETGLVAPPREPNALTEALGTLLSETLKARAARSAATRDRIEDRFTLGRAAQAFTRLHRELV
jgi:glycosyltransferase involved in cell wall biosynthesis